MPSYAGPLWRDGTCQDGWIRVERGRVTDQGLGDKKGAEPAVLLDGVYDYHTHIGDAFLRGRRLPHSLDRLVRPPHGLKHRMLATAKPANILSGMRRVLEEFGERGTRAILDFREQGQSGIELAHQAARSLGDQAPQAYFLGRPVGASDEEIEQMLRLADGLALSSMRDVAADLVARVAQACRRARRPFAMHVSEARREPIQEALAHRPDLLVHLVKATSADLRAVADQDVPVALCPSSNAFFGLRSPVAAVHKAGIRFHFGTDNAMLGNTDLVQEAARAHRLAPKVPDDALLRALSVSIQKTLKRAPLVSSDAGRVPQRLLVLSRRGDRVRWNHPAKVVAR